MALLPGMISSWHIQFYIYGKTQFKDQCVEITKYKVKTKFLCLAHVKFGKWSNFSVFKLPLFQSRKEKIIKYFMFI